MSCETLVFTLVEILTLLPQSTANRYSMGKKRKAEADDVEVEEDGDTSGDGGLGAEDIDGEAAEAGSGRVRGPKKKKKKRGKKLNAMSPEELAEYVVHPHPRWCTRAHTLHHSLRFERGPARLQLRLIYCSLHRHF